VSVSTHLVIDLAEYDTRIRTFIPDYDTMLDVAAHVVALRRPLDVVDLGTGTAALAARIARAMPKIVVTGIDADAGMLRMAARRLRRRRATLVHDSFLAAALPACDAVTASFALHHVERPRDKRRLFQRAHRALRPGGVLVSADCHPPAMDWLATDGRRAWLRHLAATYGSRQAERFLQAWAKEDFYMTLDDELGLLTSAGFAPTVAWRRNWFAVIVAGKPAANVRRTRSARFRQLAGPRAMR
jgi:ubiquinone/menaquinone biosynthesis C-methylase UbiE